VWGRDIIYMFNKIVFEVKNLLEKRTIECESHVFNKKREFEL